MPVTSSYRSRQLLACLLSVFWCAGAYAGALLKPATGAGVEQETLDIMTRLFAHLYQEKGGTAVSIEDTSAEGPPLEVATPREPHETLTIDALRIGKNMTIHAARYASDGALIHAVSMPSKHDGEDIERVLGRIAAALAQKSTVAETRNMDNVTAKETVPRRTVRYERKRSLIVRYGYPLHQSRAFVPLVGIAFRGDNEAPHHFLGWAFTLGIPGANAASDEVVFGYLGGQLGAGYYLRDKPSTIYLGGAIEGRLQPGEAAPTAGLLPQVAIGAALFRDTDHHLKIQLEAGQHLIPFTIRSGTLGPLQGDALRKIHPTEVGFSVGITY